MNAASILSILVLLILLAAAARVMALAQRRPDFDFGNMLKNDSMKESFMSLAGLGCFAIHTWYFVFRTMGLTVTANDVYFYVAVWSGAPIVVKLIDAWMNRSKP